MSFHPERAIEYLRGAVSGGRLAHAYLVTGGDLVGRESFVAQFLAEAGGCDGATLDEMAARGEIALIRPESKSRRIKVDMIRALEKTFHFGSEKGTLKIGVVADADRMVLSAENAFLKTLEEPPSNSLLILTTGHPEILLDTILSRCIRVPLAETTAVPDAEGKELLTILGRHFGGSSRGGTSRALVLERAFIRLLKGMKERVQKEFEGRQKEEAAHYRQRTDGSWLEKRENYFKALAESEYLRRRAGLVAVLLSWFGDVFRQKHGVSRLDFPEQAPVSGKVAAEWDSQELSRRFRALESLQRQLETNIQENLALEAGFIAAFG